MGKPSAPKAPDPQKTAAAQTGTNVSTALANAALGNVNQIGPDGSVTYSTKGGQWIEDPTSKARYFVPQYVQKTSLTPQQQAIKNQNDKASLNLARIGNNQSSFLNDYLSKPVNLNNEAVEARLMELGRRRLDPVLADRNEDLRSRLSNQGIKAGSDAYGRELRTFDQGANDAYTSLLLNGREQAVQEALTSRNQPINEIIGLMSGTQVGTPQFGAGTNQPQIPTVDYAGLVQSNYQNEMAGYQNSQRQAGGILGGLFGLGNAFIMKSDRRAKKDIKKVGRLMGHNLYEYQYRDQRDGAGKQIGVMAQEAEKKRPDAVVERDGVKHVDYGKLFQMGERMAA